MREFEAFRKTQIGLIKRKHKSGAVVLIDRVFDGRVVNADDKSRKVESIDILGFQDWMPAENEFEKKGIWK